MSFNIPLKAIPNQTVFFRFGTVLFKIDVKTIGDISAISIERDGVPVISGARLLSNIPVIRWQSLERGAGNFVMVSDSEKYPVYTDFGISQVLVYLSGSEIEAYS